MCDATRPTYREYRLAAAALERADRKYRVNAQFVSPEAEAKYHNAEMRFGRAVVADTVTIRKHCRPENLGSPNFYRCLHGTVVTEADL